MTAVGVQLPRQATMEVAPVRLGEHGIAKQIFLGVREADADIDYLKGFVERARALPRVS